MAGIKISEGGTKPAVYSLQYIDPKEKRKGKIIPPTASPKLVQTDVSLTMSQVLKVVVQNLKFFDRWFEHRVPVFFKTILQIGVLKELAILEGDV